MPDNKTEPIIWSKGNNLIPKFGTYHYFCTSSNTNSVVEKTFKKEHNGKMVIITSRAYRQPDSLFANRISTDESMTKGTKMEFIT